LHQLLCPNVSVHKCHFLWTNKWPVVAALSCMPCEHLACSHQPPLCSCQSPLWMQSAVCCSSWQKQVGALLAFLSEKEFLRPFHTTGAPCEPLFFLSMATGSHQHLCWIKTVVKSCAFSAECASSTGCGCTKQQEWATTGGAPKAPFLPFGASHLQLLLAR
jgi:hypothetical protein